MPAIVHRRARELSIEPWFAPRMPKTMACMVVRYSHDKHEVNDSRLMIRRYIRADSPTSPEAGDRLATETE